MKRNLLLAIFGVAICLGAWRFLVGRRADQGPSYEPVKTGAIVNSVYGIGTLTAQRSLQIKSGVTTSIQKFYVNEGESVKKGQRLVDLDGVGPFYAPFAGVVTNLALKQGETVFAQTAIMSLTDLNDLYLSVSIEQEGALKIKPGLSVRISFDGLRDQDFNGRVESVYSNGTEFLARISIQNLPQTILPGMSADVAIILNEKANATLIPVAALNGKKAVIRRAGKIITVPVEVGLIDGATAEILSGDLKASDEAVIQTAETK